MLCKQGANDFDLTQIRSDLRNCPYARILSLPNSDRCQGARCTGSIIRAFIRDAIKRSFEEALRLGLHEHSAKILVSRKEGAFLFNAGTWQAKLGDHPFRGYYSAIIVEQDGQSRIMEETVTVAAPGAGVD